VLAPFEHKYYVEVKRWNYEVVKKRPCPEQKRNIEDIPAFKRNINNTVKLSENSEKASNRDERLLYFLRIIEIMIHPVTTTANEKSALKLISRF
jgi:hypothetical protein